MAPPAAAREPTGAPALSVAGIDPERNFAGGETQVLGLTQELLAMGHRAELLCDPAGELWRRARAAGVVCHPLAIRNALDLRAAAALRRRLRAGRYDIAHFHTARAHAMAPWVRGCARAAVVTRRMDYVPNRRFARWLYGGGVVDGVTAISTAVADAMARAGVPRERIKLIPSGVDCTHFRPPSAEERRQARAALGLVNSEVAIGAVGALEPRKGHRYLFEALALLRRREAETQLRAFIAGDGAMRDELADEVRRLGLEGVVRMLGRVDDVLAILWGLDVFAMPSLSEGLGVALLEAMACGVGVVASHVGGIVDAVEDGRTGLMVAPRDARALADAVGEMAADAAQREAMGAAARARAVERFSMAAMARRTVELYRACLQTGASTQRAEG
ncbi:MAG TPA: glycosyltransferase family 4 protein [Candidatus Binataceae bacterium]|nr:glycosyltransferase family 4 protein [Candidatus Binataceae bacterium]